MLLALAFQVPLPANDTNPYIWIAGVLVLGMGALFKLYNDATSARTIRCEKREDTILEDNRAQAATIKEQSATLLKVATVAENTFAMAKGTSEKIDRVQELLERTGNARQRS